MNSYGDGNTYRGTVCKDSQAPTIITDGKTAYSRKDYPVHSSGPWQVCNGYTSFNKKYPRGYWYILNTKTGTTKIVGPVKTKGVNYFDRASEEAKTRNEKELENV